MVHEAHRSGNGVAKAEPVMIEAKKSRSPIAILQQETATDAVSFFT